MIAVAHGGVTNSVLVSVFEKKYVGSEDFTVRDNGIKIEELSTTTDKKKKVKRRDYLKKSEENADKSVNLETIIEKLDEVITSARGEA